MAMTLSKVKAKIAETTGLWDGETVDVGYRPAAVTPRLMDEVAAAAKDENLGVVGHLLSAVIDWWDVLDDDGARIPPTPENVADFPIPFLMAVMNTIQDAQGPEGKKD
jgi:hypothetical protein